MSVNSDTVSPIRVHSAHSRRRRHKSEKFDVTQVLKLLQGHSMFYGKPRLDVWLTGDNYEEWKWQVDWFIRRVSFLLGEFVYHYVEGKLDLYHVDPSISEIYKDAPRERLNMAILELQFFLCLLVSRNMDFELLPPYEGQETGEDLDEYFPDLMKSIERNCFPQRYSRKVREIRSLKDRRLRSTLTIKSFGEHENIYGFDWIVYAIAYTIDVDQWEDSELISLLKKLDKKAYRERIEEARDPKKYMLPKQNALLTQMKEDILLLTGEPERGDEDDSSS